jgi:hypothetical protein
MGRVRLVVDGGVVRAVGVGRLAAGRDLLLQALQLVGGEAGDRLTGLAALPALSGDARTLITLGALILGVLALIALGLTTLTALTALALVALSLAALSALALIALALTALPLVA